MDQWKNRVAVVTGASAGIGAAIALDLAKAGMITVGLARRVDKVEALSKQLSDNLRPNFHAMKCDVTKEEDIITVFELIDAKFNGIDVLVNNAGIICFADLIDSDNSELIRNVIDTNIMGLVFCTREAYKSMERHGRNSHVVHINSVSGHKVPFVSGESSSVNMYPASKHAVTAITEIHRQEFIRSKHPIKVSSVSPGLVRTDLLLQESLDLTLHEPYLMPEDVSQSVLHVLGTPPRVQIHELIIKPFGEIIF